MYFRLLIYQMTVFSRNVADDLHCEEVYFFFFCNQSNFSAYNTAKLCVAGSQMCTVRCTDVYKWFIYIQYQLLLLKILSICHSI